MNLMFDSVSVGAIPHGAQATAGYVDGLYDNSDAMRAAFPTLPHVTIAVFAADDAMALDVENGDATIEQAPGWVDRQHARGLALPIVYTSASNTTAMRAALGPRTYLLWTAHYDGNPHVCGSCGYPGADATQFIDHGPNGENVDQTLMSDRFFAAIGGVPAPTASTGTVPAANAQKEFGPMKVLNVEAVPGGPATRQVLSTESFLTYLNSPDESQACLRVEHAAEEDTILVAEVDLVRAVFARGRAGQ